MSIPPAAITPKRSLFGQFTHLFNRFVLTFAGTPLMPLYGVLEHRGRRSGRVFYIPVVVRPAADRDGFIVPMPWGETTDWYRNVRAAGGCRIRWKNHIYALDRPELLNLDTAEAAFGGFQRNAMRRFGIKQALRLHGTQAKAA
jgi:deazaflavin-dependent oxidoreductase (nitroreductase family)